MIYHEDMHRFSSQQSPPASPRPSPPPSDPAAPPAARAPGPRGARPLAAGKGHRGAPRRPRWSGTWVTSAGNGEDWLMVGGWWVDGGLMVG